MLASDRRPQFRLVGDALLVVSGGKACCWEHVLAVDDVVNPPTGWVGPLPRLSGTREGFGSGAGFSSAADALDVL